MSDDYFVSKIIWLIDERTSGFGVSGEHGPKPSEFYGFVGSITTVIATGSSISLVVVLAPLSTFYRIIKQKSAQGFQSEPFVMGLFNSSLWLYYGVFKEDYLLLCVVKLFDCVMQTIYIVLYIVYAPKPLRIWTLKAFAFLNMGLFSTVFLVTYFGVDGILRLKILGCICGICLVGVFLRRLSTVVLTRSVESIPFYVPFFHTLNAGLWFAYGWFSHDLLIIIPNAVILVLGVLHMVLYAMYEKVKEESRHTVEHEEVTVQD